MERLTQIRPAFDKRNPDPKKDYGIGAMVVAMVLRGKRGAVHFIWSTAIFLEETEKRLAKSGDLNWQNISHDPERDHWFSVAKAMGYDVGYHSPKPLSDYQKKEGPRWPTRMGKKKADEDGMTNSQKIMNVKFTKIGKKAPKCEWLGVPCYCDGSAMRAEGWLNTLRSEGSDKIWSMMEEEYKSLFGKLV